MSHGYQVVGWNRQKRIYDGVLWLGIVLYLAAFIGGSLYFHSGAANNVEIILLRALGTAAFVLLHIILSIGPLCRLDTRFLPLLYNRRHMGVSMFLLALLHAVLALIIYHTQGNLNPFVSLLAGNDQFHSLSAFPFQPLGFFALCILFIMAATSHDFWLANLTPPVWKALHMMVYVAYVLLVGHVAFGFLQTETSPLTAGLFGLGLIWVVGLHVVAARRGAAEDVPFQGRCDEEGYIDVAGVEDIEDQHGITVHLAGDRVAIFRYDDKVSGISNACQHQNGPLARAGSLMAW